MKQKKLPLASLQRTERCEKYANMLATKNLPQFPIERIPAEDFDYATVLKSGFNLPVVVTGCTEAFGIKIPPKDKASLLTIAEIVGRDKPVRIIEVGRQRELLGYKLGEYADFLHARMMRNKSAHLEAPSHSTKVSKDEDDSSKDGRVLNMISLEFSGTKLASQVSSPHFVNLIDWVRCLWPDNRRARNDYPRVQKYCLAGMSGSYTDFHIDFGGTSVWYHIHTGRKVFYLIPPTHRNMLVYKSWTCSPTQGSTFLGDLLAGDEQDGEYEGTYTGCTTFSLAPNETLFIPSGWIHAVYTPQDSVVFGGNFLHVYSIYRQLQCYHIETSTKIDKAYLFPLYKEIHWYFLTEVYQPAKAIYGAVGDSNDAGEPSSESADPENITIMIAQTLHQPSILLQLPILVKMNEFWLKDLGKGRGKELFANTVYSSATEGVGTNPEDLLDDWWSLLFKIADYSVRVHGAPPSSSSGSSSFSTSLSLSKEELYAHIEKIRAAPSLDLLNAELQNEVLPGFDRDLKRAMQGVKVDANRAAASYVDEVDEGGNDKEDVPNDDVFSELDAHTDSQTIAQTHAYAQQDDIDALFDDPPPPPPPPLVPSLSSPASGDNKRRRASQLLQQLVQNEALSDDESAGGDGGSSVGGGSVVDDEGGDILDDDAFGDEDFGGFGGRSNPESKKRALSSISKSRPSSSVIKSNKDNFPASGSNISSSAKKKPLSVRDMIMKKCSGKGRK